MRFRAAVLSVVLLFAAPAGAHHAPRVADCEGLLGYSCEEWVRRHAPSGFGWVRSLAVSPDATRVFVTGGGGGFGGQTYITIAYDAGTGAQLWLRTYSGPATGNDLAWDIDVAPDGSRVYVTGESKFGSGSMEYEYATVAYDALTGTQLWVSTHRGTKFDKRGRAFRVAANPNGSLVYVTGGSQMFSSSADFHTIAYDAATGALVWEDTYHFPNRPGLDWPRGLVVSDDGNRLYMVGESWGAASSHFNSDYATVAYDAHTGDRLWISRYDGPSRAFDPAQAASLSPDQTKIFVTGYSEGEIDTSGDIWVPIDGRQITTVAYDAFTGAELWVRRHVGPNNGEDRGRDVLATQSAVIVTGWLNADDNRKELITIAYHPDTGDQLWVDTHRGVNADGDNWGNSIAANADGSVVYLTGAERAATGGSANWEVVTIAFDAATGTKQWVRRYDGPARFEDEGNVIRLSPDRSRLFVGGRSFGGSPIGTATADFVTMSYLLTHPPSVDLAALPASGHAPFDTVFSLEASDVDGTIVSWSLDFGDGSLPSEGTGPPPSQLAHTYGDPGVYNARLSVTDDESALGWADVVVTATGNLPPVLAGVGNRTIREGDGLTIVLAATDPDGDPLTFSVTGLPPGASFDSASATFHWTPLRGQAGVYPNVGFEVSDGLATDSESITITVLEKPSTSVAVSDVPDPIRDSHAASLSVAGTAEPGTHVEVVVSDGVRATPVRQTATADEGGWSVGGIDARVVANGPVTVTATATDSAGNVASDSRTVTKKESAKPPGVLLPGNGFGYVGPDDTPEAVEILATYRGPEASQLVEVTLTDSAGNGSAVGSATLALGETRSFTVDLSDSPDGVVTAHAEAEGLTASASVTLDRGAPVVSIDPHQPVMVHASPLFSNVVFRGEATDEVSPIWTVRVTVARDGGPVFTMAASRSAYDRELRWTADLRGFGLVRGSYTITVVATDEAGNTSEPVSTRVEIV